MKVKMGIWRRVQTLNSLMAVSYTHLADTLNAAGLNTLHDETLNDYPSYTGSYENSRAVVQRYLAPVSYTHLDVYKRQGRAAGRGWCFPVHCRPGPA